jgi:hypothetical protein
MRRGSPDDVARQPPNASGIVEVQFVVACDVTSVSRADSTNVCDTLRHATGEANALRRVLYRRS